MGFYLMRGDLNLNSALELGKEMVVAASKVKDPLLVAEGHVCAGVAYFYLGKFVSAQSHFEKSLQVQSLERAIECTVFRLGYPCRLSHLWGGKSLAAWLAQKRPSI
jgi:hypothetical protein